MAFASIVIWMAALGLTLYYLRAWSTRSALARRQGCQPPPARRTRDPILGLYYKIQDSKSTKAFKSLPVGAALHREIGSTYHEPTLFGTTIKTSNADNIHAMYATEAKDFGVQPFRLAGMRPFCGEGLLTTDGATWERSRTMFKPSFHNSNISDLSDFEISVDQMISRIPRDGSTVDLQPLITLMFADTSTHFLLGYALGMLGNSSLVDSPIDGTSFLRAWQMSLRSCSIRNYLGFWRFLVSKAESVNQWQIVHHLIEFHIDRALQHTSQKDEGLHRSLLENLIQQTSDKVEIRNQVIQGMMAAQDTTSVLVSNTVFLLSRNPTVWERVRAEGASIGYDFSAAKDTRKFTVLQNVLHESLRLYPVFPNLARIALHDTVLPTGGGPHGEQPVLVSAGTKVLADFYALHRDREVYGEDVEDFNPDRWDVVKPGPWQYMAFGGGQRGCLGQQKALLEASYILVRLAQTFKKIESRDDREWAGDQKLTAKNVHGCKVALIPI